MKHLFVTGVTALGLAMLAGAHASATSRIDGDVAFGKAKAPVSTTVARRDNGATDVGGDRRRGATKPEDNNRNRHGASLDQADEAITVARRDNGATDVGGDRRRGATKPEDNNRNRHGAELDQADEAITVARRGGGTEVENETEAGGHRHRQRRGGRNTAA